MKYGEKLYKYSGARLYERYLLPTNPASRNPLINSFWAPLGYDSNHFLKTESSLITRVEFHNLVEKIHICGFFALLIIEVLNVKKHGLDIQGVASFTATQLLVNVYPIAVQRHTRSRIRKVLTHRENKKKNN